MDLRRLRAGEWITGASGVLLAVSLFLPWYRLEAPGAAGGATLSLSAWEAFSVVDVLLLGLAALAVALLILTAVQPTAAVGIAADALLTILAGVVAVVAVIRVLKIPGSLEASGPMAAETVRAPWAWIGLVGVFGVLLGTILAMRDERLSRPGERTDATGVPLADPPEIQAFPAPPRGSSDG